MAFTRNWDESFPANTQPANLLGQDIRQFKEDIRERVASISGDFADRPAVGDMITGWGAYSGFGMLYFATDTGAIYQWSGAAWVDVTAVFTPTLAAEKDVLAADFVSTSDVFEPTGLSVAITTSGGQVLVTASFPASASGGDNGQFGLIVDGVSVGTVYALVANGAINDQVSFHDLFAATAAAHTYGVEVKRQNAVGQTSIDGTQGVAIITAVEVGA